MELWDAYTREGEKTDEVLVRGEKIPEGRYHLCCHTLVHHRDGSVLLMKRAASKRDYPSRYEATAGGAAVQGDDPLSCIRRELWEETGIAADKFDEVGLYIGEEDHVITHFFVCTVDCDKQAIRLQEGETEGYRWLSASEFQEFIVSGEMIEGHAACYSSYFRKMNYIK